MSEPLVMSRACIRDTMLMKRLCRDQMKGIALELYIFNMQELRRGQLLRAVQGDQHALILFQALVVPLGFAFLAAQHQHLPAVGEAVVGQHRQAEGGLAGFNEAGDQVDRYKSSDHR